MNTANRTAQEACQRQRPTVVSATVAAPFLLAVVTFFASCGCESAPSRAPKRSAGEASRELSEGYSLLFELLSKERHASKILWAKFESDALEAVMEEITSACDQGHGELEKMAAASPLIDLEHAGLPQLEVNARGAIESTTAEELLKASGERFEALLLLTQLKALRYGSHLCQVIAEAETRAQRRDFLERFEQRLEALRGKALRLLFTKLPAPTEE